MRVFRNYTGDMKCLAKYICFYFREQKRNFYSDLINNKTQSYFYVYIYIIIIQKKTVIYSIIIHRC